MCVCLGRIHGFRPTQAHTADARTWPTQAFAVERRSCRRMEDVPTQIRAAATPAVVATAAAMMGAEDLRPRIRQAMIEEVPEPVSIDAEMVPPTG